MTDFQKLLEIIKKYQGDGTDYFFGEESCGNNLTGEVFEKKDVYKIFSLELKKEARSLMLNGDTKDGGLSQFGTYAIGSDKFYNYEKGDGSQPDKFTIKYISPEELKREREQREQARHDREQAERDRQQAERDRKEFERQRKERESSGYKKKCAECGQEIDWTKGGIITERPRESFLNYLELHFCSADCCRKHNTKDNNHEEKKCVECGEDYHGKDYYEFFYLDNKNKTLCGSCFDKLPKKTESELEQERKNFLERKQIEQEKTKLQSLKEKLKNSSNPAEKEMLGNKIEETENHIKDLESRDKPKNNSSQSDQPKTEWGKIFFGGAVVISVVIIVSVWIISKRRKKPRNSRKLKIN